MWHKIKVLLWKSIQIRKRYWFSTILEIFLPCVLFYALIYFMDKGPNILKFSLNIINNNNNFIYNMKEEVFDETIPTPVSEQQLYQDFIERISNPGYFIYSPSTTEAEQIMKIVAKKLKISSKNIETVNNEYEITDKFQIRFNGLNATHRSFSEHTMGYGIVFEEIVKSSVFKYKIKNTQQGWHTHFLFPEVELPGPGHSGFIYLESGFLSLQLALDQAFITFSLSDDHINYNINGYDFKIQTYPYAKYSMEQESYSDIILVLCNVTLIGFLFMCIKTIKIVADEKDSGIKELMKMMGLKSWMLWTGWILHNFFLYSIPITLITYMSCYGTEKLLNHINPLSFWIFLAMYMVAGTYFCFAISSLIHHPMIAILVGMMVWIIYLSLTEMISVKSDIIKTLFMLHPNGVLKSAFTLFTTGKGERNDSFGFILFMLIINCFLYGFIAWYLESVMPGKYGVAKPLNFLWSKKKTEQDLIVPVTKRNSRLFEKPQNEYKVGIQIHNLYKKFGHFNAVNGVTLDLYKGQITALLGHNGAGKTTTMSIITGLFSPTSGSVKVNGNDIFSNIDNFRSNLGLCPQHNLLFSYLTTLDHLIFFGMLKGMSLKKAKFDGLHLLELLNILQKKNNLVKDLSGGMKRKVSLAIALIGNPEILILDEPTSGMDPESRREMWDLLLSFRGERTILITTHFMEEADVLGDRIAIMNHGRVICYGTTLFLKKAYGTGYNLNIFKEESCNQSNLLESIKKIVPEAEVQSSLTAQIVINLPDDKTDQFPDLFKMLEANRKQLCVKGLGLSCTTMEEVFLRADSHEHNVEAVSFHNIPVDTGNFQLFITKKNDCNVDEVTNFLQQYVPECLLVANTEAYIMYNLPANKRNQFSPLFSALEVQKQNFKIISIKITSPTTGDIYQNLSTADDEQKQPPNNDIIQTLTPQSPNKIVLFKNQFKVLLIKKILYTCRKWMSTLLYGILVILMCFNAMWITYNNMKPRNYDPINLALKTYPGSSVYYRVGDNHVQNLEPTVAAISKSDGAKVIETSSDHNIINDLLKMCTEDVSKYRTELLIAGDFNQTNLTILYNSIAYHTPAVAINLYTNALLQKLSGKTSTSISTINEPIDIFKTNACSPIMINNIKMIWIVSFIPLFLILAAIFIDLPLNERVSGFKQLQYMTKLSPIVYWATCFIWDYFCYTIVIICLLIVIHTVDDYNIFTNSSALWALSTLLFVYGWSLIFYTYVFCYFYKTLYSAVLVFLLINFIIGIMVNIVISFSNIRDFLDEKSTFSIWNISWYVILLIPNFSFSWCITQFLVITWNNNRCRLCKMAEGCSDSDNHEPQSYFVFRTEENKDGILEETLILLFSSILYIAIILLFDYKIFARIYQCGFNVIVGTGDNYKDIDEDPDIGAEREKVEEAKSRPNNMISPLLVVDGLVKKFSYSFTAVRGISFAVQPGECFGLLGVNGAGKTTTFRILTGDTFPSKGDAFIRTDKVYKLSSDINEYVTMIGYCPQFDAINGKLTARESLKLIAMLRGLSSVDCDKHVDKWIHLLGLNEYKDRLCGNYSGGNKRKLNTAMALIGDPPVVFLDEPTSGVDPAARRNLWQVLAASQKGGQAVVLTSHSMDECEALCNRLTIMVGGVMKCIGNIQYLKNRYGQGFTVMIKLHDLEYIKLNSLKADIENRFAPDIILKDEHKGMLHYHITNPNIPLSEIFSQMKLIKQNFSEVEDYTVGDTTLEQVFIAFAKKQAVRQTLE